MTRFHLKDEAVPQCPLWLPLTRRSALLISVPSISACYDIFTLVFSEFVDDTSFLIARLLISLSCKHKTACINQLCIIYAPMQGPALSTSRALGETPSRHIENSARRPISSPDATLRQKFHHHPISSVISHHGDGRFQS